MTRKKVPVQQALSYDVKTRINKYHFERLQQLLASSRHKNMSCLLRAIICDKHLVIYTHDDGLDTVMEELVRLRREMGAIGNNINQIARQLNSIPDPSQKLLYALSLPTLLTAVAEVEKKTVPIIESLAEKWLQK